jgi:hypothetical protein
MFTSRFCRLWPCMPCSDFVYDIFSLICPQQQVLIIEPNRLMRVDILRFHPILCNIFLPFPRYVCYPGMSIWWQPPTEDTKTQV